MSEPPRGWRLFVMAYALGAGLILLGSGLVVACQGHAAKQEALRRHAARLAVTPPKALTPGATPPVEVRTGFYVDRIPVLGFKDASWTVDFYVWFTWQGDAVDPGKHFQVVDGQIDASNLVTRTDDGASHYELHRVTATITKVFDISRFPVDDHVLTLAIEDAAQGTGALVFVPDVAGSSTSSRVRVPGYQVRHAQIVVKDHAYKTTRGDPRLPANFVATHSQAIYAIAIGRPDWGLFLKLFLTMYVAVAVSMLVFFIKPTDVDARFGLSVGALFAVMANAYVIQGSLPEATGLSMADLITGMATLTLLLTLAQSTIALALCHREHTELADRFDRYTLISLSVAFVIANIAIPLAAA